jgi:hypothetical protein
MKKNPPAVNNSTIEGANLTNDESKIKKRKIKNLNVDGEIEDIIKKKQKNNLIKSTINFSNFACDDQIKELTNKYIHTAMNTKDLNIFLI